MQASIGRKQQVVGCMCSVVSKLLRGIKPKRAGEGGPLSEWVCGGLKRYPSGSYLFFTAIFDNPERLAFVFLILR